VLAAGLAWLPAGPAAAVTIPSQYAVQGSSDADSDCSVTAGSSSATNGPKNLHHGRAKGAVNLATTWTNDLDSSDITSVTGHYGGSTHVVKHNGTFKAATLTGSGQVTVSRALGSSSLCDVSATLLNLVEFQSSQPTGWYYVTRNTSKSSVVELAVLKASSQSPVFFELYQGGHNTVTQRAFVGRGSYITALVAGIQGGKVQVALKNGGSVSRSGLSNNLSATFHKAGSALGGTKGAGASYVEFPGSVSCGSHRATLRWKPSASHVAAGAFFVNGNKKAADSTPQGGEKIVLKHLSPKADLKITAKLQLEGGGSAVATRSYVPCKD
jgi:hypothetical protein